MVVDGAQQISSHHLDGLVAGDGSGGNGSALQVRHKIVVGPQDLSHLSREELRALRRFLQGWKEVVQ